MINAMIKVIKAVITNRSIEIFALEGTNGDDSSL